jgi:hypothetical protein
VSATKRRKTPVLTAEETRQLLDTIDTAVQRKALFEAHPQRHALIPPED